ncbi:hypothetical protein RJ55_06874 [Drechmeria coniospora]|nr:hypothetical protein RJ55_06874 [Drechmeria coniospora]
MYHYRQADDANVRPLTDEDHRQLLLLVQRYGVPSLLCALTGSPDSSGASTFSTATLLSNPSAPSLAWTSSEASQCRSDGGSIHTRCTWPEPAAEWKAARHDPETTKMAGRSWLDSPGPVPSPLPLPLPLTLGDVTSRPSPQLVAPTTKKYQCPMCFLDANPVGFGRKSDFKKHLHNFHGSDVVWICRTKGCQLSFSTERSYSTHAKEAHRMRALPNSVARTELCAQVVFACGFDACRERLFEAHAADDAAATRDKLFEHIAKHFEDGLDVRRWEYNVLVQNLMRQTQVKHTWKTCIWPKEKRQQLSWCPRSSGDLRRMLECRHLGNDISTLVRLAYILGTAPFTAPSTPPPREIDVYFQLPYRSLCLIDTAGHSATSASSPKVEDDGASTFTLTKRRSSRSSLTQSVFRLPSRQGKRASRPPTPTAAPGPTAAPAPTQASVVGGANGGPGIATSLHGMSTVDSGDTVMADEPSSGPHPACAGNAPRGAEAVGRDSVRGRDPRVRDA